MTDQSEIRDHGEFFCASRPAGSPPVFTRDHVNPDIWHVLPNGDRSCSYCGSLHPDDFGRLLDRGLDPDDPVEIGPTAKGYKVYVSQPDVRNASEGGIIFYSWHDPERLFVDRVVAAAKVQRDRLAALMTGGDGGGGGS
ncbi:MAG: hypothetical protein P1U65_07495 [Minwuia sp.]|nr:hypothetical protein [Minwuia sp.]